MSLKLRIFIFFYFLILFTLSKTKFPNKNIGKSKYFPTHMRTLTHVHKNQSGKDEQGMLTNLKIP